MNSIVQDDSMSIAYLLDFWDGLDEGDKQGFYLYAKINDWRFQQGFISLILILVTIVIMFGKGAVWPIIWMFSFLAAH